MHYYIIIHAEEEFTSLLSGRAAWAQIVILKRGFKRGRGVICGRWEHLAGVILRLQPPGGDTPRPPNTHTHTHSEMEGPGRLQATAARGAQGCALRSCALRCAHRSHPTPHPPPPSTASTEKPQGRATSAGSPSPPIKPAQRKPPPSPSAAMRCALRIAAAPRGCGSPDSARPRGDPERSCYSPAISA